MSASKNTLHIAMKQSEDSKRRAALLSQCRNTAQQQLSELIRKLYDQMDDALFELAQKSESNVIQSLYFDAMREVRLRGEAFTNAYSEQFTNRYQSCCAQINSHKTATKSPTSNAPLGLSLVEEDELEEKIAIANLTTKAQHHFAVPLAELAYRYTYLLGSDELQAEQQPLAPRIITEAFQSACSVFDVSLKIKLILYKLLDKHVMSGLQAIYDEINNSLIKQGVFPDGIPNLNAIKKDEEQSSRTAAETSFDQLSSLLNTARDNNGGLSQQSNLSPSGAAVAYLSNDVVAALSQLQPKGGEQGQPLNESLLAALQHLPEVLPDGAIGEQERNAIDLIEMIFDFIYDDDELSDHLKSIVARLQIPLLKVAILDKQFFSEQHHPARVLLNEFTQASFVGNNEKIEDKVESLVNRIVDDFSEDISLFSIILDDFRHFMLNEQQAYLEAQKIEIRKAELQEIRTKSAVSVDEIIASYMPDNPLPELLQTFIDDVWRELMINTYIEDGVDSPEWKIHLQLTEDLLWSIIPKASKKERGYLTKMIPHLVRMLSESLQKTDWEKVRIDALFNELGDCHIDALRGTSANAETFKPPVQSEEPPTEQAETADIDPLHQQLLRELEEIEHEEIILDGSGVYSQIIKTPNESNLEPEGVHFNASPINSAPEEESPVDDYYDERVAEMKLGDWVEFSDDGKNLLRARLVWHGEIDNEFIFENWRHEIIRRCNKQELASKLRNWDVRILNTVPIMERALTSVMGMLSDRSTTENRI